MKTQTKSAKAETFDVLGISPAKDDEVILLLDPKEERWKRDPAHKLVARTMCELDFDNEKDLQKCVEALRQSDIRLKQRPDEWLLWEWESTYRRGMTIIFSVAWYDLDFFRARNEAYKNSNHAHYLKKFGATAESLRIKNEILTESSTY